MTVRSRLVLVISRIVFNRSYFRILVSYDELKDVCEILTCSLKTASLSQMLHPHSSLVQQRNYHSRVRLVIFIMFFVVPSVFLLGGLIVLNLDVLFLLVFR